MGGFTGWDWSSASATRRRPRSDPYEHFVTRLSLSLREAENPEIVERTRAVIVTTAERWAHDHGYLIQQVHWETDNRMDPATVTFTLISELAPRTDGEWPSIRAAIEEDERDREIARSAAGRAAAALEGTGDAARAVSDRLDALRAAAAYWGSAAARKLPRRP